MRTSFTAALILGLILCSVACYPTPGPDKTLAGAVLGAGWGAGAGAVIGNEVNDTGPGAAIGAGFGFAGGVMEGIGMDIAEGTELEQQRQLDAMKVRVAANQRSLAMIQNSLDERDSKLRHNPSGTQIFFDAGESQLRSGSMSRLQRLSNAIKVNPYVGLVEVHGHTDELGEDEKNLELSGKRAEQVAGFLTAHGVSKDKIRVTAHGANFPLASNKTDTGRQLNRRVEIVLIK